MARIADGSIDLVLCDLPYGTTACKWDAVIPFDRLWPHYRRVLSPNGAVVLTATQPFASSLVHSNRDWFRYELIWEKSKATGFLWARRRPMMAHENILIFAPGPTVYHPQKTPGAPYARKVRERTLDSLRQNQKVRGGTWTNETGDRMPRSVLYFKTAETDGSFHPTQKPVALGEYLIRTYSDPGNVVLDNTMGSGSFGVSAVRSGRRFVGIESDPDHFATAQRRIAAARAETPLFSEND